MYIIIYLSILINFQSNKVKRIWSGGAKSSSALRDMIHEDVLANYNWDGRNGKKPLKCLKLFNKILFGKALII